MTQRRVSSSVDQTTCRTPAALAAAAMFRACAISCAGEKSTQKKVTQNAPWAPANARSSDASSSASAWTTSTFGSAASACAASELGSRVIARAVKPPSG